MTDRLRQARRHDERGVVAGAEGVAFGVLVMLAGATLLINAWAVIDTRIALDSAAREYLRAYSEADSPTEASAAGDHAMRLVLDGRHTATASLSVTTPRPEDFGPCAPAVVTLTLVVPSIRLPFVGAFGEHRVSVRHVELIDAHREVDAGSSYSLGETACAD